MNHLLTIWCRKQWLRRAKGEENQNKGTNTNTFNYFPDANNLHWGNLCSTPETSTAAEKKNRSKQHKNPMQLNITCSTRFTCPNSNSLQWKRRGKHTLKMDSFMPSAIIHRDFFSLQFSRVFFLLLCADLSNILELIFIDARICFTGKKNAFEIAVHQIWRMFKFIQRMNFF